MLRDGTPQILTCSEVRKRLESPLKTEKLNKGEIEKISKERSGKTRKRRLGGTILMAEQ